jgi:phage shock protein A
MSTATDIAALKTRCSKLEQRVAAAEANLQLQVTGPGGSSADGAADNFSYAAPSTSFDPMVCMGFFGM